MDFDFSGRYAIVTGGARGIGRAIAEELLRHDCRVLITGTGKSPTWIEDYPGCSHQQVDFLSEKGFAAFLRNIHRRRVIDILVNNAGIHAPEPIDRLKSKNWDAVMKVNLRAPMRLIRAVAPKMKAKRKGRILNISSIAAFVSKPGSNAYSASKSGLIGLTRAAALDLAPYRVQVNALCPGYTQTDLMDAVLSPQRQTQLKNSIPVKRFAEPAEIARFAVFLCSDRNTYITGQALIVDGGVSIQ